MLSKRTLFFLSLRHPHSFFKVKESKWRHRFPPDLILHVEDVIMKTVTLLFSNGSCQLYHHWLRLFFRLLTKTGFTLNFFCHKNLEIIVGCKYIKLIYKRVWSKCVENWTNVRLHTSSIGEIKNILHWKQLMCFPVDFMHLYVVKLYIFVACATIDL